MVNFELGPIMRIFDSRLRLLKTALLALLAFAICDVTYLTLRSHIWPEPAPSGLRPRGGVAKAPPRSLTVITERNIFNSDGIIAEALKNVDGVDENKAVPSRLDLALVATIILEDPSRSIAAFRLKSASGPKVFRTGESIDGLATIVRIRRGKVFLRDPATRQLQFVEIPTEGPLISSEFSVGHAGIIPEGKGQFAVDRTTFEAETRDLYSLLQQARAVPVTSPSGAVEGFKLEAIQDGSVFQSLGLRQGDIIRTVNGQRIDSVGKAAELFNNLRNGTSVQIAVERGGRAQDLNYSLR